MLPKFVVRLSKRWHLATLAIALTLLFPATVRAAIVDPPELSAPALAQTTSSLQLLRQGIDRYEEERYNEAIELWQQAANGFVAEGNVLGEALVLSDLSLAYQHLGQLEKADRAIASSLNLLENGETDDRAAWEILAKALNTQGRLYWVRGEFAVALEIWTQAADSYQKAERPSGTVLARLNQAQALQALGLSRRAEATLRTVYRDLQEQPDSPLKATGLRHLGKALRRTGSLQREGERLGAWDVLQTSLAASDDPEAVGFAWLELGNTARALADKALAIGKDSRDYCGGNCEEIALDAYQMATRAPELRLKAQLNQLSLLVETGQWLEEEKWAEVVELRREIAPQLDRLPLGRNAIYTQLNFAWTLACLKQTPDRNIPSCLSRDRLEQLRQKLTDPVVESLRRDRSGEVEWTQIEAIAENAGDRSRELGDRPAQSYSLGQLGGLYELQNRPQEARTLTQQALLLVEAIQAPDIRYRWEWQLGRLSNGKGDRRGAIAAYEAAAKTLKSVRGDLLLVNPDEQFSFRDNVEPVYRGLVDLLLTREGTQELSQERLELAIDYIDDLQLAELENFLSCDLSQTADIDRDFDRIDPTAALVYPIILEDRIEVIYRWPGKVLQHHTEAIARTEVETTLRTLRRALLRGDAGRVIENSTQVYQWLIEPFETTLANKPELQTLVFVLDGELRNIPMGVLYDAKTDSYLIEKPYALALLPSSQLFELQDFADNLQVLGAGISEAVEVDDRNFSALNVTQELSSIESFLSTQLLLDAEFTPPNLAENLNSGLFSIVHMATHGNFSSDPEETYILAYDELLRTNDLNNLLRGSGESGPNLIELLVLSACKTAEGDHRATLGLAGLAVRAGAKSTLATLWQVSDESTVILMERFYQELQNPGTTKAQALHRAQQSLVQDLKYQTPYYWAPYILVGNWR
ncbi:MAG: CHAT domain-containing protein [Cyanobacteriota bacterium]|nr:CHAT domain-containing protein [Cyanobacteriota bacterium]